MIADHRRELKTIDIRHVDVNENDSDVVPQEELERLRGITGAQQVFAEMFDTGKAPATGLEG